MPILSWRMKRQILYFSVFAVIILVIVAGLIWYFWPKPNCDDFKQNQGEEDVDCGGPCVKPCLGEPKEVAVLWTRFFKSREGLYDAAALINNPNLFAGLQSVKYQFKLYDADRVLIAVRDGSSFVNPGEKKLIFEGNLSAGNRSPAYAYLELEKNKKWKYFKKEKPFLSVIKKDFSNSPSPRLVIDVKNDSLTDIKDVFVGAALYGEDENVQAVSSTKIDFIKSESTQSANLTWPLPFNKDPVFIEIFATTDLTAGND